MMIQQSVLVWCKETSALLYVLTLYIHKIYNVILYIRNFDPFIYERVNLSYFLRLKV